MKTTYLAVMPKHRRPKAVPKGQVGYFQLRARKFYEAPGMTAQQARDAIKRGDLRPTWENGKRCTVTLDGKPAASTAPLLGELLDKAELHGTLCVLRIGTECYQPKYRTYARHQSADQRKFSWHALSLSGFTYDPQEITHETMMGHVKAGDAFELALLKEDHNGIPMGAIVSVCRARLGLEAASNAFVQLNSKILHGRRFAIKQLLNGGRLGPADLESYVR